MIRFLKHFPWVYLLVVNLFILFTMYLDKKRAERKKWRVPEFELLFIGMIGGGIGGLLAQQLFHHKTRKLRFYFCYLLGTFVAIAIIYFNYKR